MKYRADIDGLRALAVVPVVAYHAGIPGFGGGFIGVDVFFVVSGYLITGILIGAMDAGRLSLADFYERRAKRIFPALFTYVLLAAIGAIWLLPPHQIKDVAQSVVATSVFASNIFFYVETDYFHDLAETAPLLHTWSLAVEEQFYLAYPLLLVGVRRFAPQALLGVLVVLAVVSLVGAQVALASDPALAFYLMPTRFWELAVGCLLAVAPVIPSAARDDRWAPVACAAGVLAILVPVAAYGPGTPFPGLAAVPPVIGAGLIVVFGVHDNPVTRTLRWPPVVAVGLVSYSLYLSHHVVFALLRGGGWRFDRPEVKLVGLLVAVVLAWLTHRLVEQPLRGRPSSRMAVWATSTAVAAAFVVAGWIGHRTDGFRDQVFGGLSEVARRQVIDVDVALADRRRVWEDALVGASRPFAPGDGRRVLILGDSKAEDLYVAASLAPWPGIAVRHLRLDDLCMRAETSWLQTDHCRAELERALDDPLLADADLVVLSATWQRASVDGVVGFVGRLAAMGKETRVVSTANFNDVASLSYVLATRGAGDGGEGRYLFDNIRQDWRRQYLALATRLARVHPTVPLLEKLDLFCDRSQSRCVLRDDGGWFVYDAGHLTVHGAGVLRRALEANGWFD